MIRLFLAACLAVVFSQPARAVDIQEVVSPGGIKAWLVEEPSIPFMALEIYFAGGASLDREGKRGAINLMTGMIEEGAGDMDAAAFAAAREELAASYGFDVYDDSLTVSARFLTENRDESIALLKLALTEPRFSETALERVRGQVLSGISSSLKDTNDIASAKFDALAFGGHPYGSKTTGTIESVTALTRDDIVTAFQDTVARDRLYIGAVGDITADELGILLDELLGDLPATGASMPGEAEYLLDGGKTVVSFDTPQSVALFGHQGLARDDPDFFAAYVMNQILGAGGFGSRLMDEVREKRGLTYGVYTYLVPKDHAALYMGRVASSNDRVAQAIEVIKDEWAKMATEGVTQEELDAAKTYLTGAYPLRFDGNAPIARILAGMQMDELPITYIDTRNDKVDAVTLDDIKRVAARIMQPGELHFVVVGQPEGLSASN
ncbi:M16 family metallopeptidase [Litoreibacter roseus]|uniref:Peptidase M16 n=1 Tax=Litoreibacter roseus TaxID=2601869 RepID=A0A6N6JJ68_9RHOB|nr:pitrilysin family protein [Litoreibacter roseus]GFE66316.1 peptidase M16 [Litoreibacter roseus]